MKTTLFKCGFTVPCDIYGCRSMASWYVGREDGPLISTFKLCNDCAKHLVDHVPGELKDKSKDVKETKEEPTKTPEKPTTTPKKPGPKPKKPGPKPKGK